MYQRSSYNFDAETKNISRMLLQNEISLSFLVKDKLVNVRIRFAPIPTLHVDRGFLVSKQKCYSKA